MQKVILGKTGLQVSRLGFGGIPIQRIDAAGTKALFRKMKEAGINYIDTARAYTVSEELIGEAIEGMRDDFILATKSMARTYDAMKADIEKSLVKLRTDHIDLYQVHNPNMAQLEAVLAPGGALEALLEAKEAGKIRHIGLTAHAVAVAMKACELDWVETIMFPYNIVEDQGEELLAKCAEKGIAFIAMKPMAGGAIESGRAALRFITQEARVSVVIPGVAEEKEIDENLEAVNDTSPYTAEEAAEAAAIKKRLGTAFCRRCNYCAPCTVGISIPNVFLFAGYLERYGLEDWARSRYASLTVKAGACISCGACEKRCPYQLPIREMLKKAAAEFGE